MSNNMHAILKLSLERNASDIHIAPNLPPLLRINGDLIAIDGYNALSPEEVKAMIYPILDETQLKTFEHSMELDFLLNITEIGTFRGNVFRQLQGISAVFRVIPVSIPTLESLHAPAIFKRLLTLSNGLVLIVGPTGSGKSTTLAAMINYINTNFAEHIITIEDPVEYVHRPKMSLINQRQVHRDSASFSTALRAALREDPDIILVGEMRDLETIRLALTAAETGHLVLATLHTSSAPHAVSRIIDVFPANEKNVIKNLIAGSLQAVICQTLIKQSDQNRIALFEVMLGTPAVRNLIREDKISQLSSIIQTSKEAGMCTMEQYVDYLIKNNILSEERAQQAGLMQGLFEKIM